MPLLHYCSFYTLVCLISKRRGSMLIERSMNQSGIPVSSFGCATQSLIVDKSRLLQTCFLSCKMRGLGSISKDTCSQNNHDMAFGQAWIKLLLQQRTYKAETFSKCETRACHLYLQPEQIQCVSCPFYKQPWKGGGKRTGTGCPSLTCHSPAYICKFFHGHQARYPRSPSHKTKELQITCYGDKNECLISLAI